MDGKEPERMERGNTPGQSQVQSEEKGDRNFVRNGFQIFTFDSKAVVSWGLLSGVVGLCIASISVYQSFGSNVDERISNHRELNKRLDNQQFRIENLEKQTDLNMKDIRNIENELNPRKGKK